VRAAHRVFCNALVYWASRCVKEMTRNSRECWENEHAEAFGTL
jgi:hypothetical protein